MARRRSRRGGDLPDDETRLFEQAMADVERLEGRERLVDPAGPRRSARSGAAEPSDPPGFRITRTGERREGLADGVDARMLTALKAGEVPPEARIDLHGRTREEGRELLDDLLRTARTRRLRCVLVIHGRGLRSPEGPVLKEWLVAVLTRPPWARRVLAFTSSRPGWGGVGATLILLRRR